MANDGRGSVARLPASGRLRDMHRRLDDRLARAGLDADSRASVLASNASAMLHRLDILGEEEHFETLHSARSILILLDDCGVTDADVLAAAASIESEHARLRVEPANALARATPLPDAADMLLEELVVADAEIRMIALAERLDHARHLHLRAPSVWRDFHRLMESVYAPAARRSHARLEQRYDWWCDMFRSRFLDPAAPG